jgi:hypothetical protein
MALGMKPGRFAGSLLQPRNLERNPEIEVVSASTASYLGDQNDGQGPERPIPGYPEGYLLR